jgi:hypothetical protein
MRNGNDPTATEAKAQRAFDNFVSDKMGSCTCLGLAEAMHATQDAWAQGHMNFPPWSGGVPSGEHLMADRFPSQGNFAGAISASVDLIKQYGRRCGMCFVPGGK